MAAVVRSRAYLALAVALAALVFAGFARSFYLRYWFDVPPISKLVAIHGVVFTLWFVLFVTQVRLISKHNYQLHRQLGVAGAILAVSIVLLGLMTSAVSAGIDRPRFMAMTSPQFVIFPTTAALAFGGLVAAAIGFRRKPEIHRRLMMLAMISVLGPPVARVLVALGMREHFLVAQTAVAAAFVIACLTMDWVRHRTVHPIYAIGGLLVILAWPLRAWAARTPAWEAVGNWMASLT